MDLTQAMRERHSVRAFRDEPLTAETIAALQQTAEDCNREGGLCFQLFTNEPEAFSANKPNYGAFQNCKNYLALVAPKGMDERVGYYGERFVLTAQTIGVNSCWVALTYKKGKTNVQMPADTKLYMVIALGYGQTQGTAHKSKTLAQIGDPADDAPDWYVRGLKAVLLAPTAINQQKFRFALSGNKVIAKAGVGFYTKVDLGIAKYHFELGAEKEQDIWS